MEVLVSLQKTLWEDLARTRARLTDRLNESMALCKTERVRHAMLSLKLQAQNTSSLSSRVKPVYEQRCLPLSVGHNGSSCARELASRAPRQERQRRSLACKILPFGNFLCVDRKPKDLWSSERRRSVTDTLADMCRFPTVATAGGSGGGTAHSVD
eukprot:716500-Pyramimonas_sp.AAC.2